MPYWKANSVAQDYCLVLCRKKGRVSVLVAFASQVSKTWSTACLGREVYVWPFASRAAWFNPRQQLSTTKPLTHSPLGGVGERIGRVKVRKLVG